MFLDFFKNFEKWSLNFQKCEPIFGKYNFGENGDSPKPKNRGQTFLTHFWRRMPTSHFKTKMGSFGCKMSELCNLQVRILKILKSPAPIPSNESELPDGILTNGKKHQIGMPRNFFFQKKNWIFALWRHRGPKKRFFGFRPFSDHIFSHCFTYNGQTRAKFGEKLNLSVMKIFH